MRRLAKRGILEIVKMAFSKGPAPFPEFEWLIIKNTFHSLFPILFACQKTRLQGPSK